MSTVTPEPRLSSQVPALLAALRARIRRYVMWRGVAWFVATLAFGFWLAIGFDWWFEPSRAVRVILLIGVMLVALAMLWKMLLARLLVPLADRSMALLIERHHRAFRESLLTSVELQSQTEALSDPGRDMLATTFEAAAQQSGQVDLRKLFDVRPLRRALLTALLLIASVVIFSIAAPLKFRVGWERLLIVSDEPWPRDTHLSIEGFENGTAVVPRGADLRVVAKAGLDGVVPPTVELRYRTDEGFRERKNMVREGNAAPTRDSHQLFQHTFLGILSPIRFEVRGGDARVRGLTIRVVESPSITTRLYLEYPPYMLKTPGELDVTASVNVPRGTRVTVRALANKPLTRARVDYQAHDAVNRTDEIALGSSSAERFEYVIDPLDVDRTLRFTLSDTDGITKTNAAQLSLVAVPDTAPQLNIRLVGIGSAITPQARIPLGGELRDDYGVARAWIEHRVGEDDPVETPFKRNFSPPLTETKVDEALDVAPLGLKPGQKLILSTRAADALQLPDQSMPNVGQGERFALDIVTPEALRAILEGRELNLRQRFEQTIAEVTETRAQIASLDEAMPNADEAELPPERRLERSRLRVERGGQNSQKNAEETEGVALSFEDIRAELVNNRIDTEELKIRLQDQIADPLHRIARERFPALTERFKRLEATLADPAARVESRKLALAELDRLLEEMNRVKDKMIELETFNEVLELLRDIIAQQQRINEETKKLNKGNLLKDL